MISLQFLGAAGSIGSVILILLTYKWGQIPRVFQVEEQLRGRLETRSVHGDGPRIRVNQIRCWETENWIGRIKKFGTFKRQGVCEVEFIIPTLDSDNPLEFEEDRFQNSLDKYGDSAEVFDIGAGPKESVHIYRVDIESLDPDICYLIIKEFPDYLSTGE